MNPCPFGFGHRRRHSPRVYPTAFRRWMQRSAKPAIGRWRLSLADRLGDEGRQRGTSLWAGHGDRPLPSPRCSVPSSRLSEGAKCSLSDTVARECATQRSPYRGLYPSASPISDLLGDRNVMRSHTAQAAWREVLGELGWQHDRAAEAEDDLLALLATSRPGAANFQTSTSSADQ